MKAVIDSNVLLVAIGRRSRFNPIWQAFINTRYQLIITDEIVLEYQEILQGHAAQHADKIVLQILADAKNVIRKHIFYRWNAITVDPDDNKFFDAAVAAGADYLVTNDAHFNEAKKLSFPNVNIITADVFLEVLL